MSGGFQRKINYSYAPGFLGSWATQNPRRSVVAGPLGFRAGAEGVSVGAFAWQGEDGTTINNFPPEGSSAAPDGFVFRDQEALTSSYLQSDAVVIPEGFGVSLSEAGDVFVLPSSPISRGQVVAASFADGSIVGVDEGSPAPSGYVLTNWFVSRGSSGGTYGVISSCGPSSPTPILGDTVGLMTMQFRDGGTSAADGVSSGNNPYDQTREPVSYSEWSNGWQDQQSNGRAASYYAITGGF